MSTSTSSIEERRRIQPLTDPHSTEWSDVNLTKFAIIMSVFATAENAVFYPFYTIKTREQSHRGNGRYNALESFRSVIADVRRSHGLFRGLYRGFWVSSLTALPAYGVYMAAYTSAKDYLKRIGDDTTATRVYAPFVAGLLADIASVALYVPGDVVVQRLQMANSPYRSFTHACSHIYATEGISGFYRGFGATFLTSGVASAVWWCAYENAKTALYATLSDEARRRESDAVDSGGGWAAVNRWPQLTAGFIAGTVTSTLINPLDVVKTRLQTHMESSAHHRYANVIDGLRSVYREEGVRGYMRGLMPKLISRGPLSAVSSIMYELVLFLSRNDIPTGVKL